jgi:hypothetical protein
MHSEHIIALSTDKRHIHMEGKSYELWNKSQN